MIARPEAPIEKGDVWAKLAAPLPQGAISWRQDGRIVNREGMPFARFVACVEANAVRERLDAVIPGDWDLTLDLLPPVPAGDDSAEPAACAFKARLQILGVVREDVGTGKDYKQAATEAFKRAAVRFGIASELHPQGSNWVLMDGDGRDARPVEDPAIAYERSHGRPNRPSRRGPLALESPVQKPVSTEASPHCPKCEGAMWDNRATKRNPKAPDFKCRDKSCDGVIWPEKHPAHAEEPRSTALVEDEYPF